jgi:hypothetical protein
LTMRVALLSGTSAGSASSAEGSTNTTELYPDRGSHAAPRGAIGIAKNDLYGLPVSAPFRARQQLRADIGNCA